MKYSLPKETIRTDKSSSTPVNNSQKVGINSDVTNTIPSSEIAPMGIPGRDETEPIEESGVNLSANNCDKGPICPDVISTVTNSTIPPIDFSGMDENIRIDKSRAVTARDNSEKNLLCSEKNLLCPEKNLLCPEKNLLCPEKYLLCSEKNLLCPEENLLYPGVNVTSSIDIPRTNDNGDDADPSATLEHNRTKHHHHHRTEIQGFLISNVTASIDILKTADNANDPDPTGGLVHVTTEYSRLVPNNCNSAISIGLLEHVEVNESTLSIYTIGLNAPHGIVHGDNRSISNLRNSDSAIGINPLDNVAVVNGSLITSTTSVNTTDSTIHGDYNTNNSRIFTATSFDIGIKVGTVDPSLSDDRKIVERVHEKTATVNDDDPSLMDVTDVDDAVNINTKINSIDPYFMDVRDIVDLTVTQCDSPDDGIVRVSTTEQYYRSPTSPEIVRVSTIEQHYHSPTSPEIVRVSTAGPLYHSPIDKQNNESEFESFQETIRCLLSLISFHLSIGVGGVFDKNREFKRVFMSDTYKTIVTLEFALTYLGWDSFLKEKCPQQYKERFGAFSTYHLNSELEDGLKWVRLVYLEYVLSFQRRKLREYDLDIYIQSSTTRNIEQFNKKRIIDASRQIYDCSYRSDESFDAEESNSHSQITTFNNSEYDVNDNGKRSLETISHCSNYMHVFQSLKHLICYDAAVNWFVKVQNEACRLHRIIFGDPVEGYSEVLYGSLWSLLGEAVSGIQDLRVDLIEGVYFYHHSYFFDVILAGPYE
jgi:hypothetical protein